jgi:hypothetical protein
MSLYMLQVDGALPTSAAVVAIVDLQMGGAPATHLLVEIFSLSLG